MENYVHRLIPSHEVLDCDSYRVRYSLKDCALERSISMRGILVPVIVLGCNPRVVVAGHRRVCAARSCGLDSIRAFELQGVFDPRDLFLYAVLSNLNQNWTDLDRAWTIRKALDHYQFQEKEVIGELLPAIGLKEGRHVMQEYYDIARLDPLVLEAIAAERLPFRGVRVLERFSYADQREFVSRVVASASLTTNELLRVGEWLCDFMRKEGSSLAEILARDELAHILNHSSEDRRQKGEELFRAMRDLRFPRLADYEKKFSSVACEICQGSQEFRVEAPHGFEEEGWMIYARIRDRKSLDHLKSLLHEKHLLLNSLFDIML